MPIFAMNADDFVAFGLRFSNFNNVKRLSRNKNLEFFKSCCGCSAKVCEQIWMDLQTNDEINNDGKESFEYKPKYFLLALRFLKEYSTENQLCSLFGIQSPTSVQCWSKEYVIRIHLLLQRTVSLFMNKTKEQSLYSHIILF